MKFRLIESDTPSNSEIADVFNAILDDGSNEKEGVIPLKSEGYIQEKKYTTVNDKVFETFKKVSKQEDVPLEQIKLTKSDINTTASKTGVPAYKVEAIIRRAIKC